MKTLGLIGGMSWESTALYYRRINEEVRTRLGGLHSAKLLLHSVDFAEIVDLQRRSEWTLASEKMTQIARGLEAAGADLLVICTNTMHKLAPAIESAVGISLLHIADPTAEAIARQGLQKVGLLGTRFTMEQDFYVERLRARGFDVLLPPEPDRAQIHRIIFEELCVGIVKDESRQIYRDIMARLVAEGAQGIILGCTEITMLVGAGDAAVPLFDTTALHARGAVDAALHMDSSSIRR